MNALVVGAGSIGGLLANHLAAHHEISIFDLDMEKASDLAKRLGARTDRDPDPSEFDLVLVSVPISSAASVVRSMSSRMRKGSSIIEVSSIKSPVIGALREVASRGITVISIHPLFGPGLKDLSKGRAALIPVENGEEELRRVSAIFPFDYVVVSLEEHDRAMAWLALIHLILHAFLASSRDFSSILKSLETTSLKWFLRLGASSLLQSESLTRDLIRENPYFPEVFENFLSSLKADLPELRNKARSWLSLLNADLAYRSLYE